MSKYISLQKEQIEKILSKIRSELENKRSVDGSFKLDTKGVASLKNKANLYFSPKAYVKMHWLVEKYSTEVGWHGVAKRINDNTFFVYDVIIYPHTTNAATITADDAEYSMWYMTLDDETFENMKFHGHSHVNMGCTPSSIDMEERQKQLNSLPTDTEDSFYIFIIMNKKGDMTGSVYDLKNNIFYDTSDITFDVIFDEDIKSTASNFIAECKKVAKQPVSKAPTTEYLSTTCRHSGYGGYGYGGAYGGHGNSYGKHEYNSGWPNDSDDLYSGWYDDDYDDSLKNRQSKKGKVVGVKESYYESRKK